MYVEDDSMSREVMKLLLVEQLGYQHIQVFADGQAALDHLRLPDLMTPDLILLDIHMTPISGFELLHLIRQDPRLQKITVVALTASVMSDEVQQVRQAGFDGIVAKPLDIDTFPGLLKRILAGESIWRIVE
jgi:CheY-like chemotaxis protein